MAAGASGRHGNHAACHVERETGHVPAHVLIQRQNGTERIAQGQISPRRDAICTNVKVDHKKSRRQQFMHFVKLVCHGLLFLITSEWQLESMVAMATMQRDMWRGKHDTCPHMF